MEKITLEQQLERNKTAEHNTKISAIANGIERAEKRVDDLLTQLTNVEEIISELHKIAEDTDDVALADIYKLNAKIDSRAYDVHVYGSSIVANTISSSQIKAGSMASEKIGSELYSSINWAK